MGTESRVVRIERDVRSLALEYVQEKYRLSPGDLDKLAALRAALAELNANVTFAEGLEIMFNDLNGKTAADFQREDDERERQIQQIAKWESIARLAGLDPDVSRRVGRELTMAFEPGEGETVTVETLLALDRRIYETALEQSR